MKKRRLITLTMAIVALLGLIWWAASPDQPAVPDPVYAGHPLSYWVSCRSGGSSVPMIDSKAVPYLVHGVKGETHLGNVYGRLWRHLPVRLRSRLPSPLDPADVRQASCRLLSSLGMEARPAIPELIHALREDAVYYVREDAALALANIAQRKDAAVVEALAAATKDPDARAGQIAGMALWIHNPEAALKAGLTNPAAGTPPPTTNSSGAGH
jgi:hypothetical protein